jgi:hypothetical protein
MDIQPPGALIDGDLLIGPQDDSRSIRDASFGIA